jgi:hypothetical protein
MTATGRTAPPARGPAPFARGRWPALAAWALAVLAVTVVAATFPLGEMARHLSINAVASTLVALAFAAVGVLVALRQPGNRMGWLLLAGGVFIALNFAMSYYDELDYRLGYHLPFRAIALLLQPSWAPAVVCLGLAVMLFPDGRLPSPRLRWISRVYLGLGVIWTGGALAVTVGAIAGGDVQVDSTGNLVNLDSPGGADLWWGVIQFAFFIVLVAVGLGSVVGQAVRFRRSRGERRQQLKWLLAGTVVAVVGLSVSITGGSSAPSGLWQVLSFSFVLVAALPLSIGVAVLRYRLYDIDRVISRTLAYTTVTGLLVGAYAGLVLLTTTVLSFSSDVAVAVSTLAAAALFNPLRRRVQHLVDRRFNRARYDADRIVADFAARLQDAAHPDAARLDLTATVQRALEPVHLSLWIGEKAP